MIIFRSTKMLAHIAYLRLGALMPAPFMWDLGQDRMPSNGALQT